MKLSGALLGTSLIVFWSSGFVGATLATRVVPFETALAWRTLLAAAVLTVVAVLRGERISRAVLRRQVVLGLLVQVVYLGGVFAATGAGVPAGTVALIAALQPLLVAALAGPLLGAAPNARQRIGLVIGAGGVALVVAGDIGGMASIGAFALPVLAVVGLAMGTLLEGRWQVRPPLVTSLAVQSSVAAVVFAATAGLQGRFVPPASSAFWLAIAWLVVLAAFGGYGTYLLAIRRFGATTASSLLYLTPPTTALWAWALFDQTPGPLAVPGVLVCACGVAMFARGAQTVTVSSSLPAVP